VLTVTSSLQAWPRSRDAEQIRRRHKGDPDVEIPGPLQTHQPEGDS